MKSEEFIDVFQDLIQTDMELTLDTVLADIEEWDSMAIMAFIAWLDVEKGVGADFERITGLKTVADAAHLVPDFDV